VLIMQVSFKFRFYVLLSICSTKLNHVAGNGINDGMETDILICLYLL